MSAGKQENNWGIGDQRGNVGHVTNEQRRLADSDGVVQMALKWRGLSTGSGQEPSGQWRRWACHPCSLARDSIWCLPHWQQGFLFPHPPMSILAVWFLTDHLLLRSFFSQPSLLYLYSCFPRAAGNSLVMRVGLVTPSRQGSVGPSQGKTLWALIRSVFSTPQFAHVAT